MNEPKSPISKFDAMLYCILIVGPQATTGFTMEMVDENRKVYLWITFVVGIIISCAGGLKAYRSGRPLPEKPQDEPAPAPNKAQPIAVPSANP